MNNCFSTINTITVVIGFVYTTHLVHPDIRFVHISITDWMNRFVLLFYQLNDAYCTLFRCC